MCIRDRGYSFDWDRVVNTTDPSYYKWTQWIFLQLYKHGLAYKTTMPVNWCTSCKCVLANEEVVEGVCAVSYTHLLLSALVPRTISRWIFGKRLSTTVWRVAVRRTDVYKRQVHILHLEALSVQSGQRSGIGGEVKLQAIGVQRLTVAAILFVLPLPAILAVPDQGVSGMGELGPDLVGPTGDQVAFHQRQATLHRQSAVEGHRRLGPGLGAVGDIGLLFHLVLKEKTLQLSLWGTHAPLDHAQVILVPVSYTHLEWSCRGRRDRWCRC